MGIGGKGDLGTCSNGKTAWDDDDVDFGDDDDDLADLNDLHELGELSLGKFCKKASSAFFRQYGLISHQINSYNDFIKHGVQRVFDLIGEISVEPGYDPSKKGDGEWRYASIRFGKVTLERPQFWTGEKFQADGGKELLPLFPWHARLQNMTYSARIIVQTHIEIYTQQMIRSDKFKTGKEQYLHKEILKTEDSDVLIGRVPVMVKSDLCWTRATEKDDCHFDHGSYFIVKGAEKAPFPLGKVCFLSSPDGENCGLVKNIALTGLVSTTVTEPLLDRLTSYGMEKLDNACTSVKGKDKVLLDGEWIGICADSLLFAKQLRRCRRCNELPNQVEIKRDAQHGEVRIFCDAGRILRPLLAVENLRKINTMKGDDHSFQSLLDNGVIELIGVEEEEDCCTAWGVKYLLTGIDGKERVTYTQCELDLSFLLGLSCGMIPFASHNHAKRVLYQSAKHSHQAIGFSTTNPNVRVDTLFHQLFYPQKATF